VKQQQVPGHHGDASLSRRTRHTFRVAHAQGERLLDQAGLARVDALPCEPGVRGGRRGDDHRVRAFHQLDRIAGDVRARMLARDALPHLGIRIAHGCELSLRRGRGGADVVLPPGTCADDAQPQAAHR